MKHLITPIILLFCGLGVYPASAQVLTTASCVGILKQDTLGHPFQHSFMVPLSPSVDGALAALLAADQETPDPTVVSPGSKISASGGLSIAVRAIEATIKDAGSKTATSGETSSPPQPISGADLPLDSQTIVPVTLTLVPHFRAGRPASILFVPDEIYQVDPQAPLSAVDIENLQDQVEILKTAIKRWVIPTTESGITLLANRQSIEIILPSDQAPATYQTGPVALSAKAGCAWHIKASAEIADILQDTAKPAEAQAWAFLRLADGTYKQTSDLSPGETFNIQAIYPDGLAKSSVSVTVSYGTIKDFPVTLFKVDEHNFQSADLTVPSSAPAGEAKSDSESEE